MQTIFEAEDEGAVTATTKASQMKLTWCDSRVKALALADGTVIQQTGSQWFMQDRGATDPLELDFTTVEKWFSQYCSIMVTPDDQPPASWQPGLEVTFIKGSKAAFLTGGSNLFKWKDTAFRSDVFAQAIKDLANLPPTKPR